MIQESIGHGICSSLKFDNSCVVKLKTLRHPGTKGLLRGTTLIDRTTALSTQRAITGAIRHQLVADPSDFAGSAPRRVRSPGVPHNRRCRALTLLSRLAAGMTYYSCSPLLIYKAAPGCGPMSLVDPEGFEPSTFSMPLRRAPRLRYGPWLGQGHLALTRVDLAGFEPATSSVRLKRAPNCATGPHSERIVPVKARLVK